jgi:hypothetical protein
VTWGSRVALVAAALLAAASPVFARDSRRVFRTIESEHFIVHYWEPEHRDAAPAVSGPIDLGDIARRVAVVAERAHRVLAPALDHVPSRKTLIYVTDDTDSANGFASVLPRNAIQIYATAPGGFSELDDYDDWLYGLVAHEYTHILHLDTMEGLPNVYNSLFGKTWAPNQVMPRWVIEGIATYEESKRTSGGRNRGTRFDELIRIARHADRDMRLDQITGAPRQFPRGNAAYIYGSHFLQYVFDRFGDDALREMSHTSGSYAPPFAINRQIAKVVGTPFTELYDNWKAYLRDRYGMQEMAAERRGLVLGRQLTNTGEANLLPHYSADGKELLWLQYDGFRMPHVRAIPVRSPGAAAEAPGDAAREARDVVQVDAMGPFDLLADGSIVFEQGRLFRAVYSYVDLWRWDARTGHITRLTTGRRARDPAVSPDERKVAYSQNERSTSVLAVMDLVPDAEPTIVWRGAPYEQVHQPQWSPDGTRIAFSAWRQGGYRDILIVDVASGAVQEITRDRAIDLQPRWSADGALLFFASDRTSISNIYAYDLADKTTWQVTNVVGGAFQPEPSPDGTRLAFISSVPRGGYDLFELPLVRASWIPARDYVDDRPMASGVRDDEAAITSPRPYRAAESLAPQAWTLGFDTATRQASIATNGSDAVGLHGYSLALGLDVEQGQMNIGASYGYFRYWPALRLAVARTLVDRGGWRVDGVNRRYREEDWSATLAVAIPFEARPSSNWTLSFDYDVDWFRLVEAPAMSLDPNMRVPIVPPTDYVQAGIGTRIAFSTVRGNTFGVGAQNGFDGSVSLRFDHPALGAEYRNITVSYATQRFQRIPWGRTPVLAMRLTGAIRTGDLVRLGGFGLGGVPAQDIAMSVVNSIRTASTGYLRGYPVRTVAGNQFHLLNTEYRHELFWIERGLATLPVYLRRVHFALLSDVGTAWDGAFDAGTHMRASLGGALRLDAFFGYFVPGTFELGYARGLTSDGINEAWFLMTGTL